MKAFFLFTGLIMALINAVPGQEIFRTTYDNRFMDLSQAILQTSDGGYLLAGKSFSAELGHMVGLVIKYDPGCKLLWKKEIGAGNNQWLEIFDATETPDHQLLLTGRELASDNASYDLFICKLDQSGELAWEKSFGGSGNETGYKIISVSGNDLMVAGIVNSADDGRDRMLVGRVDGAGNLVWLKAYGEDQSDEAYGMTELHDGGFIVIGACNLCSGRIKNLAVIKLDRSGTLLWNRTLESTDLQVGFNAIEDNKGNIIVSGISKKKNKCRNNLMLAQFSPDGILNWIRNMKMEGCVGCTSIAFSGNDDIYVGGTLFNFKNDHSRIFITRMDMDGKTKWTKTVDGLGNETCNAMILNKEKDLVIAGEITDSSMNTDILLVKTSAQHYKK